ncbi:MAG: response regulator [Chlorobiaceae bacterium]|nr:response regulator [Chlorobiaceae bacterium]
MIRNYFKKALAEGTMVSDFNVLAAGILGAPAHLIFYFLFKYGFHLPYENFYIRMVAVFLSLSVIFRKWFPSILKRYFPYYWHFSIIVVLPFIFTTNLLMNNFHELWLYWEIFMVFILIAFVPNWLIFLIDLFLGVAAAFVFFLLSAPGFVLNPHFNVPLYSIVIFFTIVAGYIFSYSNSKGQIALERNAALQAIAAGIAHEMRNPLGQVRHNIEAVQDLLPAYSENSMFELNEIVLEKIYRQLAQGQMAINRGAQVIDMILAEVRDEHQFKSGTAYLSATAVTHRALDEYGYESEEERSRISFSEEEDFLFKGIESMYLFVIFNLVMNALYFLRLYPDGTILIRIHRGELMNYVTIKDTGPGISKENLPKIFDPFFTSGKKGGTGLGLAYCRRVMHQFGGEINCESVQGEYTEFTLSFPVVKTDELAGFHEQLYRDNRERFDGKCILLADHDQERVTSIISLLEPLGCKTEIAKDGPDALMKFTSGRYDLFLCEIDLPVFDCFRLTHFLKGGNEASKPFPVVVYSAQPSYLYSARAEKSGIVEVLTLPLMLQPLVSALSKALSSITTADEHKNLSEKKVLVVDDSAVNRTAVRAMLQNFGIEHVIEAKNGFEALEIIKTMSFDLLLLDIQMPLIDGIEVTKRIRNGSSDNRMIPIVAMSGESDSSVILEAMESGMNAYLVKPVNRSLMKQKIIQVL